MSSACHLELYHGRPRTCPSCAFLLPRSFIPPSLVTTLAHEESAVTIFPPSRVPSSILPPHFLAQHIRSLVPPKHIHSLSPHRGQPRFPSPGSHQIVPTKPPSSFTGRWYYGAEYEHVFVTIPRHKGPSPATQRPPPSSCQSLPSNSLQGHHTTARLHTFHPRCYSCRSGTSKHPRPVHISFL